jgi:hypothetical protein
MAGGFAFSINPFSVATFFMQISGLWCLSNEIAKCGVPAIQARQSVRFTFDWTNGSGSGFINSFPQFRK